jgi:hypothetical protein
MGVQNGGLLARTTYRAKHRNLEVQGIYGINRSKHASLGGVWKQRKAFTGRNPKTGEPIAFEEKTYRTGSRFWVTEWGFSDVGVYFADCLDADHQMIALDYRTCGSFGEPQVIHVHRESNYDIMEMAPSLEIFLRGLTKRRSSERHDSFPSHAP